MLCETLGEVIQIGFSLVSEIERLTKTLNETYKLRRLAELEGYLASDFIEDYEEAQERFQLPTIPLLISTFDLETNLPKWELVYAKEIEIEGMKLALHPTDNKMWAVTEIESGCLIAKAEDFSLAFGLAEVAIKTVGKDKIVGSAKDMMDRLPPKPAVDNVMEFLKGED